MKYKRLTKTLLWFTLLVVALNAPTTFGEIENEIEIAADGTIEEVAAEALVTETTPQDSDEPSHPEEVPHEEIHTALVTDTTPKDSDEPSHPEEVPHEEIHTAVSETTTQLDSTEEVAQEEIHTADSETNTEFDSADIVQGESSHDPFQQETIEKPAEARAEEVSQELPIEEERPNQSAPVVKDTSSELTQEEPIGDPNCPNRSHIIKCCAKYMDSNYDGKLSRNELDAAINKLPW